MTIGQEKSIMLELEDAARAFGRANIALGNGCDDGHEYKQLIDQHADAYAALLDVCRRMVIARPEART